jgi:hypothetical protein
MRYIAAYWLGFSHRRNGHAYAPPFALAESDYQHGWEDAKEARDRQEGW